MNVSFDGLRTNATRGMNRLHDTIKKIIENDNIYDSEKEELIKEFNTAAMYVDSFNCLYDDNVKDDMNSMDDLSIDRLDELDDEDE